MFYIHIQKQYLKKKNLEHKYDIGIKVSLLSEMLQSLGWDTKVHLQSSITLGICHLVKHRMEHQYNQ